MKITYISHSGVLVEHGGAAFLFDYFDGELPDIPENERLVVFCSHFHADHFNPAIFDIFGGREGVTFVLSGDIRRKIAAVGRKKGISAEILNKIVYMKAGELFVLQITNERSVRIETLLSTDEGVAFAVTYKGRRIYHAGDLNLWVWEDNAPDYDKWMRGMYKSQIEKLKGKRIDIAFLPVDGRLGSRAFEGADMFMRQNEVIKMCPIHMGGDFEIVRKFIENDVSEPYRDRILDVSHACAVFEID